MIEIKKRKFTQKQMQKKIKILHVISSVNPIHGGPAEGIRQLYKHCKKSNLYQEIMCMDKPNSPWLKDKSLPKIHAVGPAYLKYAFNFTIKHWLKKNLVNYDMIILNGLWQYPSLVAANTAVNLKIPYWVFCHGMLDPWFQKTYFFKKIKKTIYWKLFQHKILKKAQAVFFTTEQEKILAKNQFLPYRIKEELFPYGISGPAKKNSFSKNPLLKKYPELKNKKIILFLGRIAEKKGCDILIKAFSKIRNSDSSWHLLIVGFSNKYSENLKKTCNQLNISARVTWIPGLFGDDKWNAYYLANVFCLPSHQENFGISVIESISAGIPVIISNKVNTFIEIKKYNAGFICNDNVNSFLTSLKKWIKISDNKRKQISNNGKELFKERFHAKQSAKYLKASFINFIKNKR